MRYLLSQRHAYRNFMALVKRNPERFSYGLNMTFRDWLDLPF